MPDNVQSIPMNNLYAWQQVALMRLMLFVTGRVHQIVGEFNASARDVILAAAGADGQLTSAGAYQVQVVVLRSWGDTLKRLTGLIQAGQREGASLPFGVQAAYHEKLVVPAFKAPPLREAVVDGVFENQLQMILDAAALSFGPDGLQFSSRIWRMDRDTREGINSTIMQDLADKKSAWQLAKDLESFLGAGKDCPRWTYARLNSVASVDKAKGDLSGLLSNDPVTGSGCGGKGVSYNALRLARTEIQRAHHDANDNRMAAMPWIEQERIVLSGSHPEHDICDDVVAGGEDGKGIYPKGTIKLPLHPHCFCDKRAVQDLEAFGNQLAGWVQTGQGFAAMDQYAASLGADVKKSLLNDPVARAFGVWAFDHFEELAARMAQ